LPVAIQICWDIPAGLNGLASKPLPASGHITGGVRSVGDTTSSVGGCRRFSVLPMDELYARPIASGAGLG
jgi:hypothetical protein